MIAEVLEQCPSAHWRAIVGLTRYAGLRCPTELVGLQWGDVDWTCKALTVRSPKISNSSANLRTTLHKIIARAGHKPWPRLFQNLRGSCETDWVQSFPSHEVASWLGHSPTISVKHHLKHKDLNVQAATGPGTWVKSSNAESNAQVTQNTTPHPAAPVCMFSQFGTQPLAPYEVVRSLATPCKTLQSESMGEVGFEPTKAKPTDLQSVLVDHLSIRPSHVSGEV